MTPKASLVAAITAAAVVWDGAAARPAAARCQPAVSVKGDDDDVARIARALNQYQVASQSTSGCAAWQVTASRASGQLALQIDDGHGLTLVRRVTSPAAAAAVIDSWVHHNLAIASADGARSDSRAPPQHAEVARPRHPRTFVTSAHALETVQKGGKAATPTEPSRAAEAAPTESRDDKEPATAPKVERTQAADTDLPVINRVVPRLADAAGRRGPVSVGLGAEASFGNDGSVWWGGHLSGCMTVGSFCVGLLARGDTTALNAVGEPGSVKRRGADGLAFIGVPIALGRMTLLPEVGLGAGVRRSTVSLQNTDPAEPPTGNGDNPAGNWTLGIRSMTRATLVIPVWERLAFDVSGSIDGSFANRFLSTDGDGAIPGEPNVFVRGGVALRYGAP